MVFRKEMPGKHGFERFKLLSGIDDGPRSCGVAGAFEIPGKMLPHLNERPALPFHADHVFQVVKRSDQRLLRVWKAHSLPGQGLLDL